jgi:hypothetical protein
MTNLAAASFLRHLFRFLVSSQRTAVGTAGKDPPAEPGALYLAVSRSKRLRGRWRDPRLVSR